MKTLSELKRDLKDKKIQLALVNRFGEHMELKWRNVKSVQSNGFYLECIDDTLYVKSPKGSFLDFPKASLVEYDDFYLRIYIPGYRELTKEEKECIEGWVKITRTPDYLEHYFQDVYTDGSYCFNVEKEYYSRKNMLYLMGCEEQRGMKYDFTTKKVRDEKIKGDLALEYVVRRI